MQLFRAASTSMATSSDYNRNSSDKIKQTTSADSIKLITEKEYDPLTVVNNVHKASQWNQGEGPTGKWDPVFCFQSVEAYRDHLRYIEHYISQHKIKPEDSSNSNSNNNNNSNSNNNNSHNNDKVSLPPHAKALLSDKCAERALKAMLKMKIPTHELSQTVRDTEKLIGSIGFTPLTHQLSLRLLEANGKAGNIGRTIALLELRKARKFKAIKSEFQYAIQSIHSAGLYLRKNRNIFLSDFHQPDIDNPTRWLDAILVNMSSRHCPLDTILANRMLECYASTGKSGKALHFFYKITQREVENDVDVGNEINIESTDNGNDNGNRNELNPGSKRKTKIRMKMNNQQPPFYKLPTDVLLQKGVIKRPRREGLISKLNWEKVCII
jgi:hypothetical protein